MKVVHAADLHLDSPLVGLDRYPGCPVGELRGATRGAFDNVVSLCLRERAGLLLIAGDVFDGDWKDFNSGHYFNNALRRLAEVGTRVVVVRGNHDAANDMTRSLRLPEFVHLCSAEGADTIEVGPVAVHGLSYRQREVTEDLVPRYPEPRAGLVNVGLLHTNVGGRPGHAAYAPTTPALLAAKGYHYWALGHVHEYDVVTADPWVVYPGNPQGRSVRETGARGCVSFEVGSGGVTSLRRELVDVARWEVLRVAVSEADRVDDALARVARAMDDAVAGSAGRTLALRVHLAGDSAHAAAFAAGEDQLVAEVRGLGSERGAWVEKVRVEVRPGGAPPRGLRAAVHGLARELADDPATLRALCAELEGELGAVLPLVRRQEHEPEGLEVPDVRDGAALARALARAEALLGARLGGT